jgi:hypothetical protein
MSPPAFINKSLNALEAQRDTQNRTDMRFDAHRSEKLAGSIWLRPKVAL